VLGREKEDFAYFPLPFPALANPSETTRSDTLDVKEKVRDSLEYFQRVVFVDGDDPRRELGANAGDRSRCQVFLDAFGGGWVRRFQFVGFELLAVFPVDYPATARLEMFPYSDGGRVSHDGNQFLTSFSFHPQHHKPALRVVVGDSLDESCQSFSHCSLARVS
jgi:hypothetical protein